uniref:uncharacterized protein LOC101303289 isoform X1 n=2 Tax=Fragaria vesca subsp. vesca TaxID=101020 RepID=UPI0005C81EE8|nr:PREDICTED: uncharacterized protein LOC101303289 isoform X1 [Fragaria vesca subsp. vesca]
MSGCITHFGQNVLQHHNLCDIGFRLGRMFKPTYFVEFSEDIISKDLKEVWEKEVESVFAFHRLTCRMDEDECKMVLETGNCEGGDIVSKARRALNALACGLSAQWVKPILHGQIYCDMIQIRKPEGMTEEQLSSNYDDFIKNLIVYMKNI